MAQLRSSCRTCGGRCSWSRLAADRGPGTQPAASLVAPTLMRGYANCSRPEPSTDRRRSHSCQPLPTFPPPTPPPSTRPPGRRGRATSTTVRHLAKGDSMSRHHREPVAHFGHPRGCPCRGHRFRSLHSHCLNCIRRVRVQWGANLPRRTCDRRSFTSSSVQADHAQASSRKR